MTRGDRSGGDSTGTSSEESAPPELARRFWTLVVLLKVAVLVTTPGILLLVLTDRIVEGTALTGLGMLVGVRWMMTYRRVRAGEDD